MTSRDSNKKVGAIGHKRNLGHFPSGRGKSKTVPCHGGGRKGLMRKNGKIESFQRTLKKQKKTA